MSTEIIQQSELFNYDALDTETRLTVKQKTTEIHSLRRVAGQSIVDIGQKLLEVKDSLKHTGAFLLWLKDEFDWSYPTANRYMAVAEAVDGVNLSQSAITTSALYLLSSDYVPEDFRKEILDRAEKGEKITHRKVDEALKDKGLRSGFRESLRQSPSPNAPLFANPEVPTDSLGKIKPDKSFFQPSTPMTEPEEFDDEDLIYADPTPLPPALLAKGYKLYEQRGQYWCSRPGQSTAPQPSAQTAITDAVALETLLDDGWTFTQQTFYCATKGNLSTPGYRFTELQCIAILAMKLQKENL